METFSLFQIIIAFLAVIFVPAILIHFTLGRNGGHHLYDKTMTPDEIKKMPYTLAFRQFKNKTVGSFIAIVGVVVILLLLNAVCNAFGMAESQKNFWMGAFLVSFFIFLIYNRSVHQGK